MARARSLGVSLAGNVASGAERGAAAHLKAIAGQLEGVREDFVFVLSMLKNLVWSAWAEKSGDGRATNGEEAS
jgi:hypothetical protein